MSPEKHTNSDGQIFDEFQLLIEPAPAIKHPWVEVVESGELTDSQIIAGELQHYHSVRARAKIYTTTLWKAIREGDDELTKFAAAAVREELCNELTHADILYQFLAEHGIAKADAVTTPQTLGTQRGIALLNDQLETLSALECIAMMAIPEWEYGGIRGVAARIQRAYAKRGFSKHATETFSLHAEVDVQHGNEYFNLLAKKILEDPSLKDNILSAMKQGRDAFVFERDGQYQAATGELGFHWEGTQAS